MTAPAPLSPARAEHGFALTETLVAAAIVAAMLGVFVQTVGSEARTARMIADRREAALVARSALDQAIVADAGQAQGGDSPDGRLRWRLERARHGAGAASGAPPLERITVVVVAADSGRPLARLSTLRLGR